jgi:hypothetical protein
MSKFVRLVDNTVMEIFLMDEVSLNASYHPDIVATCVPISEDQEIDTGWVLRDGFFSPPPPPPPPPPSTDVSFWQFMMAAWKLNFITHAEALAAVRQRIMPPAFAQAIADLPAEAKLAAEMKFAGITRMLRSDPLFALVVEAKIATDEQIDGVFAVAEAIQ